MNYEEIMIEKENRLIKRYANRKLYDTSQCGYLNYSEIFDIIHSGEDVTIIDNKNKNDISYFSMIQIIQKKEQNFILNTQENISFLNNIIRSKYGTFSGYILDKKLENIEAKLDSYNTIQ